jgi:hypothetical protein
MVTVETGPLTLGEILDRMFTIYRRNFVLLVSIAGIPYAGLIVVGGFLAGLAAVIGAGSIADFPQIGSGPAAGIFLVVIIVMGLIFIVVAILSSIGTYAAVWDIQIGRTPGIRRAYSVAWSHAGAAIVAGILSSLATAAGFLLLIIPGIIVWLALSLVYPVIIAEDSGGSDALRRSWELTKGYRWKIFVASVVTGIVSLAITYGIQIPLLVVSTVVYPKGSAPIWFTILNALGSVLGGVIPAPLLAIATCVIYYDARVRKEGFDLQRLLDELPQENAGASPQIAVS